MAFRIRRIDYFHVTVANEPGEAYKVLSSLAAGRTNLLAFTGVPMGEEQTQFTIFPEDVHQLERAAKNIGLVMEGPHAALLVQGDDELGALARIHQKLAEVDAHAYASSGITDGKGSFGYVLHIPPQDIERAAAALNLK